MNLFATFLGFLGFFKSREYGLYYLSGTTDLQYTNIIVGWNGFDFVKEKFTVLNNLN